jgi:hypothetical protein
MEKETKSSKQRNVSTLEYDMTRTRESEHSQDKRQNDTIEQRCGLNSVELFGQETNLWHEDSQTRLAL